MIEKEAQGPQPEPKAEETKTEFRSSFKAWVRVVAFIVVAVFLPEQVAQAVEYDWRVLWQKPPVNTFAPNYLQDTRQIDIPVAIKKILTDIANKPINEIKISSNLSVKLEKPLNISKKRIEEIYEWLKGRPCGSKALYDFLSYQGLAVAEQDIAVLALTIDILNEVVKPEGNPEVIKNSLYALAKVSEFFGSKLYPVKILDLTPSIQHLTPFIAHLKGDHYILVTRITDEKVYFIDEHKEEFLPREKFLEDFSGFCLVANPAGLSLLTEKEAKLVLGALRASARWRRYSASDAIITALVSGASMYFSAASPASWTKNIIQPAVTYGITYAGQRAHWNPYLTAGVAQLGAAMVGSAAKGFSGGFKGSFASGMLKESVNNVATVGTTVGIKYAGRRWGGIEDLAASIGGQIVNRGLSQGFNRNCILVFDASTGTTSKAGFGTAFLHGAGQGLKELGGTKYVVGQAARYGMELIGKKTNKNDVRLVASIGMGLSQGLSGNSSWKGGLAFGLLQGGVSYGLGRITRDAKHTMLIDLGAMAVGAVAGSAMHHEKGFWKTTGSILGNNIKQTIMSSRNLAMGWGINNLDSDGLPLNTLSAKGIVQQTDFLVNVQKYGWEQAYMQTVHSNLHYQAVDNLTGMINSMGSGLYYTLRPNARPAVPKIIDGQMQFAAGTEINKLPDKIRKTLDLKKEKGATLGSNLIIDTNGSIHPFVLSRGDENLLYGLGKEPVKVTEFQNDRGNLLSVTVLDGRSQIQLAPVAGLPGLQPTHILDPETGQTISWVGYEYDAADKVIARTFSTPVYDGGRLTGDTFEREVLNPKNNFILSQKGQTAYLPNGQYKQTITDFTYEPFKGEEPVAADMVTKQYSKLGGKLINGNIISRQELGKVAGLPGLQPTHILNPETGQTTSWVGYEYDAADKVIARTLSTPIYREGKRIGDPLQTTQLAFMKMPDSLPQAILMEMPTSAPPAQARVLAEPLPQPAFEQPPEIKFDVSTIPPLPEFLNTPLPSPPPPAAVEYIPMVTRGSAARLPQEQPERIDVLTPVAEFSGPTAPLKIWTYHNKKLESDASNLYDPRGMKIFVSSPMSSSVVEEMVNNIAIKWDVEPDLIRGWVEEYKSAYNSFVLPIETNDGKMEYITIPNLEGRRYNDLIEQGETAKAEEVLLNYINTSYYKGHFDHLVSLLEQPPQLKFASPDLTQQPPSIFQSQPVSAPEPAHALATTPDLVDYFRRLKDTPERRLENYIKNWSREQAYSYFEGIGDAQARIPDINLGNKPGALFNRDEEGNLIGVLNPKSYNLGGNPFEYMPRYIKYEDYVKQIHSLELSFDRKKAKELYISLAIEPDDHQIKSVGRYFGDGKHWVLSHAEYLAQKGNVEAERFLKEDLPEIAVLSRSRDIDTLRLITPHDFSGFQDMPPVLLDNVYRLWLPYMLRVNDKRPGSADTRMEKNVFLLTEDLLKYRRSVIERASEDSSIPEDQRAFLSGILEFNISRPERYIKPGGGSWLQDSFKNAAQLNNKWDKRKLAVVIVAHKDGVGADGAFTDQDYLIKGLLENKNIKVVFVEAGDVREVVSIIKQYTQPDIQQPKIYVVEGHGRGAGEGIVFGPGKFGALDRDTVKMFKEAGLENRIAPGVTVALYSCESGATPADGKPGIASLIHEGLGRVARVLAPINSPPGMFLAASDTGESNTAYFNRDKGDIFLNTLNLAPWPVIKPPDIVGSSAPATIVDILRAANIEPSTILWQRPAAVTYTSNLNDSNRNSSLPTSIRQSGVGSGIGN